MITLKWDGLGQIFDCEKHLPDGCISHAQSPQALTFDDKVRIYFSSRKTDDSGKFLSHVAYADFDPTLQKLLRTSDHEIIPLGELGCFDEHGIFPFSPSRDEKSGEISAYTCGWSRRISVDVETSTGFARSSDDGETFQKLGHGPVFGASLHEPMLVGDSLVRKIGDRYFMWYMYGKHWIKEHEHAQPDRVYKIGLALSDDGINWKPQNRQIIPDARHENECQALPSVLYHNGYYHMVFCHRDVFGFRDEPAKGYRIGYAYSLDGAHWARNDIMGGLLDPQGDWDRDMMAYPHLYAHKGAIYCLYNGNTFGKNGYGAARLLESHSALAFKLNHSAPSDIKTHLLSCSEDFYAALESRCNVDAYCEKLTQKSVRLEIWKDHSLLGLAAIYLNTNEEGKGFAFISHIGTAPELRASGLAYNLLRSIFDISKAHGLGTVQLEVHEDNAVALGFYRKHGFEITDGHNNFKRAIYALAE